MMDSGSLKATKNNFQRGLMNLTICEKIFFQMNGILVIMLRVQTLIFKGKDFHINRKLSIKIYQKPENRYRYVLFKSAFQRHTLTNYILGELQRYVRINTEELNFLKIRNIFFQRMRNSGFNKNNLSHWFSEVKY